MVLYKLISILLFLMVYGLNAQESKQVLFLGNSYTYVNDLPQLLNDAAASVGDNVITDQNTPGGYSLEGHSTNAISLDKIRQGNWDFVVLQEQSQRPSLQDEYVEVNVYPYAQRLNDTIVKYNFCSETAFYMTWGRENGDASNCSIRPPVCTYEGMDDLLKERYLFMANDNEAITSPVGAVWRYLRDNDLNIDLYSSDGSHPSLAGSYTAAITFYTVIFKKDPTFITFNSTLSETDATIIKDAVKIVVYNNLTEWFIGNYNPVADFSYVNNGNLEYAFANNSVYSTNYLWDFGDENTSTEENPIHVYSEEGNYEVTLTANYLCENPSIKSETISVVLGLNDFSDKEIIKVYPNPVKEALYIELLSTNKNEINVEIYNISGILIKPYIKEPVINGSISINVEDLNKGVYFLKISSEDKNQIEKFIKN